MANSFDYKNNLRKLDFPACATEALPRIESLIVSRNKQNHAMQLISDFVFLERSKMNSFQEFQLILVMIDFFSQPGPDAPRNAVFLSLFGSNLTQQRSKILCRMISTAVSGSVAPLLSSAGTWMQQVGCTTPPSLEVAQSLVSDFITFARKTSEQLKQLPMVAPHFAANLMTAVADLYMNEQRGCGTLIPPPEILLDVFTEWITENPTLCLAAQHMPHMLPAGAIAMPVVSPLGGLIRWTVLAPLACGNLLMYSNLHLSLLQTLLVLVNSCKGGPSSSALHAQDLIQIVSSLQKYATKLTTVDNIDLAKDACYQKCVERFAQAVQLALKANCIFGNTSQLICALESLSGHSLLNIVIDAHKNSRLTVIM